MTTLLNFTAPPDLSVGRIRLEGARETLTEWIATPVSKELRGYALEPGVYTAIIEPLGQAPISFVFNVEPGRVNDIGVPPISMLARSPQAATADLVRQISEAGADFAEAKPLDEIVKAEPLPPPDAAPATPKRMSVGLSEDHNPYRTGGWRPCADQVQCTVALIDDGVELLIDRPTSALPPTASSARLRLSIAIEATRVERMMVPLYAGGTRLILRPSMLTTQDLELLLVPVDVTRRALTQALRAGVVEEARALCAEILGGDGRGRLVRSEIEHPWTLVVLALLDARFPIFGGLDLALKPEMIERYSWISDVHVLEARRLLQSAGATERERARAAEEAVKCFERARRLGAPYFAYANQIACELLGALAHTPLGEDVANLVTWEHDAWIRNAVRQRGAGAAFSWVMAEPKTQSADSDDASSLVGATRGGLDERYARIVFRGELALEHITPVLAPPPETTSTKPAARPTRKTAAGNGDPPALQRPIKVRDDPNKGRFGGEASRDGYRLSASFSDIDRQWVKVNLAVDAADAAEEPSYMRAVSFFLHDSFDPDRLEAFFRGGSARASLYAWGGFTVGAWIPDAGIELELDLAEVPDAPRQIVED